METLHSRQKAGVTNIDGSSHVRQRRCRQGHHKVSPDVLGSSHCSFYTLINSKYISHNFVQHCPIPPSQLRFILPLRSFCSSQLKHTTLHSGVPVDPASLRTSFFACQVPFCTNSHHHLPVLMKFPGHLSVSAIPVAGIQQICCLSASFTQKTGFPVTKKRTAVGVCLYHIKDTFSPEIW